MMESSVSVCPVPAEQQPLNEYEELKSSGFFALVPWLSANILRNLLGFGAYHG